MRLWLWSIYFQFTFTTITHPFNKHLLCTYNVPSPSSPRDVLFRNPKFWTSLHMHDLAEAICCWEKNIRYSRSMFEVSSVLLLRKQLTEGKLLFYSQTNLNCTPELFFGVQVIVSYGMPRWGEGESSAYSDGNNHSTFLLYLSEVFFFFLNQKESFIDAALLSDKTN